MSRFKSSPDASREKAASTQLPPQQGAGRRLLPPLQISLPQEMRCEQTEDREREHYYEYLASLGK